VRSDTQGSDDHNWLTDESAGGSAADKNWPGKEKGQPYTSSAAEMPESSRGAARKPRRTQGRCCGQSALASLALSASFSRWWNLSTRPLDWGW
jgi:hypothetical protein